MNPGEELRALLNRHAARLEDLGCLTGTNERGKPVQEYVSRIVAKDGRVAFSRVPAADVRGNPLGLEQRAAADVDVVRRLLEPEPTP